jgi:hypothetical protein
MASPHARHKAEHPRFPIGGLEGLDTGTLKRWRKNWAHHSHNQHSQFRLIVRYVDQQVYMGREYSQVLKEITDEAPFNNVTSWCSAIRDLRQRNHAAAIDFVTTANVAVAARHSLDLNPKSAVRSVVNQTRAWYSALFSTTDTADMASTSTPSVNYIPGTTYEPVLEYDCLEDLWDEWKGQGKFSNKYNPSCPVVDLKP